jgi:hypothetical protein
VRLARHQNLQCAVGLQTLDFTPIDFYLTPVVGLQGEDTLFHFENRPGQPISIQQVYFVGPGRQSETQAKDEDRPLPQQGATDDIAVHGCESGGGRVRHSWRESGCPRSVDEPTLLERPGKLQESGDKKPRTGDPPTEAYLAMVMLGTPVRGTSVTVI